MATWARQRRCAVRDVVVQLPEPAVFVSISSLVEGVDIAMSARPQGTDRLAIGVSTRPARP